MKILQLGKFYPVRGGVERVMYDLMTGLSEQGVDCDMLCAHSKKTALTMVINGHARLMACRTWFKAYATMISPAMIGKLRRIAGQYDIIHVHHPDPMACLALFLSGYKGKVVLHWHSDIEKQKMLLKLYRPLQRWLLKRADIVVGTTPVYLDESPYLKGVRHKAVELPIGINPILPGKEKVEQLRSRYPGKKIIFSLGRMVHYKGFKYLIQAAHHLPDDYVVIIGGEGPLRYELIAEVETWGVQDKVILTGRIGDEDLPNYYGACDLFCLPSVQKTEAFGIVQIEAMSCGKPVVATNIKGSGVAWVNRHGVSGLNVEPMQAEELARAIVDITGDGQMYRSYCEGARKRYEDMFTSESMINKVIKIYNSLWK